MWALGDPSILSPPSKPTLKQKAVLFAKITLAKWGTASARAKGSSGGKLMHCQQQLAHLPVLTHAFPNCAFVTCCAGAVHQSDHRQIRYGDRTRYSILRFFQRRKVAIGLRGEIRVEIHLAPCIIGNLIPSPPPFNPPGPRHCCS
jgi:hypothetical protein